MKILKIKWVTELENNTIILSTELRSDFKILSKSYFLHFGAWKKEVILKFDNSLSENIIGLPIRLMEDFVISDNLPYEIYIRGVNIYLGPVIAILANKKDLTPKLLNKYWGYFLNYHQIKGLIYICSLNGINQSNKTVEGYYYKPPMNRDKAEFIEGVFPYPYVVYRRIKVSNNFIYNDLIIHAKHRVFNQYRFNKYELWQALYSESQIRKHLPHTKLLINKKSLDMMLKLYGTVYLKPINGSFGKGIIKVMLTSEGYLFINWQNIKKIIFNRKEVSAYLERIKNGREYIVQQDVGIIIEKKNIDFRVIMQKDENQNWSYSGTITRFGKIGRICTNDVSEISLGKDALQNVFSLSDKESYNKEHEIIEICTLACETIEYFFGNYGDVGIDIVIDSNLKVWILEINDLHQHILAAKLANYPQIYEKVITRPLEYAKSLAGF